MTSIKEAQDYMAIVYKRIQRIKMRNQGDWPHTQSLYFTPEEIEAILSALEIAGEL